MCVGPSLKLDSCRDRVHHYSSPAFLLLLLVLQSLRTHYAVLQKKKKKKRNGLCFSSSSLRMQFLFLIFLRGKTRVSYFRSNLTPKKSLTFHCPPSLSFYFSVADLNLLSHKFKWELGREEQYSFLSQPPLAPIKMPKSRG